MNYRLCDLLLISAAFMSCTATMAAPRFHLRNKSGKAIAVTLYDRGTFEKQYELKHLPMTLSTDVISTGGLIDNAAINKIKFMKISYCDDGSTRCAQKPNSYIVVSFDLGGIKPEVATYYLSFYVNKQGKPIVETQKGTARGLFGKKGKTIDGYGLEHNVQVNIPVDEKFKKRAFDTSKKVETYQLEPMDEE